MIVVCFLLLSADRDDRSFGRDRDRNRDSERFESDWRARPATDTFDDYPPRRGEDSFGDSEFIADLTAVFMIKA